MNGERGNDTAPKLLTGKKILVLLSVVGEEITYLFISYLAYCSSVLVICLF